MTSIQRKMSHCLSLFAESPTMTFAYGITNYDRIQPRHSDFLYQQRKSEEEEVNFDDCF